MAHVSILTPVYNGEKFLRPCIESVLKQTHQDWEYVFVDNCSEDATPEIIREYARQDRRIRIVTNESFVGIIENHNIAFSQMSPKADYCKVVQADDWIYPECLEKFVRLLRCEPGGLPGDRLSPGRRPRRASEAFLKHRRFSRAARSHGVSFSTNGGTSSGPRRPIFSGPSTSGPTPLLQPAEHLRGRRSVHQDPQGRGLRVHPRGP
ncbi:MAG: glycosyltransferase [Candidatus Moduliflexus flocculans]|nr:glycosyltransferase [Candidatus Moduliflexus flocculans]